ncbi:MAG: helix-turn-helix domain-containing protein [Alphaproteobacteria bacterium]|nr:helix-turn-helix domain-containing protein [Alphaproteobacteria bacterium]
MSDLTPTGSDESASLFSNPQGQKPFSSPLAGFLTPKQLAAELGISLRTLARWHARRIGPARCVIGKLIRYRLDAVKEWLAANETELGLDRSFRKIGSKP